MGFHKLYEAIIEGVGIRDPRFSSFVEDLTQDWARDVEAYLGGEKPAAVAEDENWKVVILPNNRELYINKAVPDKPVGAGKWMGFWDPDLEEVVGLSKEEYDALPTVEQKEADAEVQLRKYVPHQFWSHYAEFYYPEDYDKWWWDEGGKELSAEQGEAYWRKEFE